MLYSSSPKLLGGAVALLLLAVMVGVESCGWKPQPVFPNKTVRVGLGDFPPYLRKDPSGRPAGFVVDLIEAAAKRMKVPVEWVEHSGPSGQPGLDRGDFDIAPMLVWTPYRDQVYAMSPVWWESALGLMSPKQKPVEQRANYHGVRIGILRSPLVGFVEGRFFPGATVVQYPDFRSISDSLCRGETDAIVISRRPFVPEPEEPGCVSDATFTHFWFGGSDSFGYSMAGRKTSRAVVDAFYSEFVAMETDGTFTAISQRFGIWNPRQSMLTREFILIRSNNKWLWMALSFIGAITAYLIWQNRQMRSARGQAEAASQAKSRFLAMMSHEIRTPLNGVMGMSELLSASELNPQQQTYVEAIRSSGSELLTVLNDVLDFSRIEAGKMTVESIEFSPAAVAESTALLMNRRAAEKSLPLALIIHRDVPASMKGDPTRFRQVLNNLLSNAIKFTESGWITIRVELSGNGGANNLRVSVSDTGVGIEPSVQRRLFEPFIQADSSIARKYGGTGLGLAICRQLVELMGGSIGVRSRSGEGSLFWFEIPAVGASWPASLHTGTRSRIAGRVRCPDLREAIQEMLADGSYFMEWVDDLSRAPNAVCFLSDHPVSGVAPLVVLPQGELLTGRRLIELISAALSGGSPGAVEFESRMLAGMRILVAEDNRVNQRVVDSLLRRLGCVPTLAENGRVAVQRARQGGLEAILMDLHMPEMDGLEAARQIREFDPRIPILAFTAANEFGGEQESWRLAGMSGWIGKPLEFEVLRRRLEELRGRGN